VDERGDRFARWCVKALTVGTVTESFLPHPFAVFRWSIIPYEPAIMDHVLGWQLVCSRDSLLENQDESRFLLPVVSFSGSSLLSLSRKEEKWIWQELHFPPR
jgi:hypothetical protein